MATADSTNGSTTHADSGNARVPSPVPPALPPPPTLQDRIQTLTEVHARLTALRHVPIVLLEPPSTFSSAFDVDQDFSVTSFSANPAHDLFQTVKSMAETMKSEKVQDALRAAQVSEEGDKSELGLGVSILGKRGRAKRKRPLSPVGSPQPYIPPPARSCSLFSPPEDDPPPLRADSLFEFVRSFNRGTLPEFKQPPVPSGPGIEQLPPQLKYNLVVWSRIKRPQNETMENTKPASSTVLRFTISDVLTAYVSLVFRSEEDPLVVENVTVFGPRERKLPHEQSDYQVYQALSQHVAKMLQSHPSVPLQTLMHALASYRTLFIDRCTSCQRVLSVEGHIPPVGRVWIPKDGSCPTVNSDNNHSQVETKEPTEADPQTPEPAHLGESVSGRREMADHSTGHWEPRHVTCLYS